jgi:hypothetical protein
VVEYESTQYTLQTLIKLVFRTSCIGFELR